MLPCVTEYDTSYSSVTVPELHNEPPTFTLTLCSGVATLHLLGHVNMKTLCAGTIPMEDSHQNNNNHTAI